MNKTVKATAAGLLGYAIYGFSFIFSKIALDVAMPNVLLSYRFLLAFLILNLFLLTGKFRISFKGKSVFKLLMMGFIQPVIYFVCEANGIAMTSASFSGVIIGLVPVAGLIFGVLFLRERCGVFQIICTVLSVVGVVLTTTGGVGDFSLTGFCLLLISVFSTTAFTVISRNIAEEFSPFERTYAMTALGGLCFTVLGIFETKGDIGEWIKPLKSGGFCISVIYLAVISSVCAFLLINYALNHLSVGHTLIFSNFTAVISVIAGVLVMDDSFNEAQIAGIVIILLSVFGVSAYKLRLESGRQKE